MNISSRVTAPAPDTATLVTGRPRRTVVSRKKRNAGLPWILPAIVVSVGVLYYCIGYTGMLSFMEWDGASPRQSFVGIDNYARMVEDPVFWKSLRNTAFYFVVVFASQVILGFTMASILHSKIYLRTLYKVLIFIPVVIAPATVAPVFREIYAPDGQLNSVLDAIGLGALSSAWLANGTTALIVVMSVAVWQTTGIMFVLYYAAMSQIDLDTLEAARLDGAGEARVLGSIVWPGVRGTTVAIAVLTAIDSLKVFDIPFLITDGGPNNSTEFLGTQIYDVSVALSQVGYGSALSIVLLIVALTVAIIMNLARRERVTSRV
ncbi:carbohydrate ABC transporter permease [Microbacterium sp. GXF0217]